MNPLPDDQPGRYALIGRYGELMGAILERMRLCVDCGAVVLDTDAHDRHHGALERSTES